MTGAEWQAAATDDCPPAPTSHAAAAAAGAVATDLPLRRFARSGDKAVFQDSTAIPFSELGPRDDPLKDGLSTVTSRVLLLGLAALADSRSPRSGDRAGGGGGGGGGGGSGGSGGGGASTSAAGVPGRGRAGGRRGVPGLSTAARVLTALQVRAWRCV